MTLLLGVAGVLLVAAAVLLGVAAREYARRGHVDLDADGPAMPAPPAPPAPRPASRAAEGLPGRGTGEAPVHVAPPPAAPAPADASAAARRSAGATIIAFDDDDDQD